MDKKLLLDKLANSYDKKLDDFIIFSGNIYTFESALNEILSLQKNTRLIKWLSAQSGIIYLPDGVDEFKNAIKKSPPIFLQHFSPIQYVLSLDDISAFSNKAADLCNDFEKNKSFSVQTTLYQKTGNYNANFINNTISEILLSRGKKLDVKNPYNILSIAVDNNKAYIGISNVKENLSKWACGRAFYKKELNRAEYKLVECIEYFRMKLTGGKALDIGAAPGGWTKALYERGYKVYAIDPIMLDKKILETEKITQFQMTAQKFLTINNKIFDIIVNDMVLDCRRSAGIMNDFSKFLEKNGYGIITAKLPKKKYNKPLKSAVKLLEEKYTVIGVHQLPSNKSEVTILLRKKA